MKYATYACVGLMSIVLLLGLSSVAGAQVVNQPPTADAGSDQTVEQESWEGTEVTLDASGSSDPDDDPLTFTWAEGTDILAGPTTDAQVDVMLPLGSHTVTLTVDDDMGGTDTDDVVVVVVDTTPPSIDSASTSPSMIWPPNHKMVNVSVNAVVTDICDSAPTYQVTAVESDEPENGEGDGDTAPDFEIIGDHSVKLRAERAGGGDGRTYTITIVATDASGNTATGQATVVVPHDRRGGNGDGLGQLSREERAEARNAKKEQRRLERESRRQNRRRPRDVD